jgi:uncharacterized protein YecT (DUF1311 family)
MLGRTAIATFVTVASLLAAAPSRAQDDPQIEACHQLSTADMSDCFDKLIKQWDRHLNVAYQKTLKTVDPSGVPALRAAERAWLEYRKERCLYLSAGPGTIGSVVGGDCMVRMLRARALELEEDSKGLGPG